MRLGMSWCVCVSVCEYIMCVWVCESVIKCVAAPILRSPNLSLYQNPPEEYPPGGTRPRASADAALFPFEALSLG